LHDLECGTGRLRSLPAEVSQTVAVFNQGRENPASERSGVTDQGSVATVSRPQKQSSALCDSCFRLLYDANVSFFAHARPPNKDLRSAHGLLYADGEF
jgi:hypothetical protein